MYLQFREKLKSHFYGNRWIWPLLLRFKKLYYKFNYIFYFRLPVGKNRVSLREINLEFNSTCNLRCKFCALDFGKERQIMSPQILQQVLDEILFDPRLRNVKQLNLYNGGETLLHPDRLHMFNLIGEAKKRAASLGKPFPKVLLLTNGMLLRGKLAEEILQTGALDVIQFSLDGGSPQRFEDLRVNAKWSIFKKNVATLSSLIRRGNYSLEMKSITIVEEPWPLNTQWMHPEFKDVINLMNHYELRRLHDWGGEVNLGVAKTPKNRNTGCMLLMTQLVVLPNGDITVCCNDLNSKGVVGNLHQKSLFDVYRSPERMVYIDKLYQGKKQDSELCKNCEVF